MGEIADMMIDGDLCIGCGVVVPKKGLGFPVYCSKECRDWHGLDHPWYENGILKFPEDDDEKNK